MRSRVNLCVALMVLVLAVSMVVILSLLGLAMIRLGSNARLEAIRVTSDLVARTAADAGITQALAMMNQKLAAEGAWDNSTLPAIADDSGLVVEALGGEPGVHSARWAGPDATDAQRCSKLLAKLGIQTNRSAAFECVISIAVPKHWPNRAKS